jgi:hypothetical protein
VRFELGHANNLNVSDPSPADDRTQPAIVMIGRVSDWRSPARGKLVLGLGALVVVVVTAPVVVTDAWFPPPPERPVTQKSSGTTHALTDRLVTASV